MTTLIISSGCATTNLEEAAPQSLMPAPAEAGTTTASTNEPAKQANETGTFPNINDVPEGETGQIDKTQKAAAIAELNAARSEQRKAASGSGVSNESELKRLARSHAREALKEIENE